MTQQASKDRRTSKIPPTPEEQSEIKKQAKAKRRSGKKRNGASNQGEAIEKVLDLQEIRRQAVVDIHIRLLIESSTMTTPTPSEEEQAILDALLDTYRRSSFEALHVGRTLDPMRAVILTVDRNFDTLNGQEKKRYLKVLRRAKGRFMQAWNECPYRVARQMHETELAESPEAQLVFTA